MAAALLVIVACVWWLAPGQRPEQLTAAHASAAGADRPDAGASGLGEAATATSMERAPADEAQRMMAEETPPEPLPGQAQPDSKGRCPHRRQVVLNGACWAKLSISREECEDNGGHPFKGACYLPYFSPGRSPTSGPGNMPRCTPE